MANKSVVWRGMPLAHRCHDSRHKVKYKVADLQFLAKCRSLRRWVLNICFLFSTYSLQFQHRWFPSSYDRYFSLMDRCFSQSGWLNLKGNEKRHSNQIYEKRQPMLYILTYFRIKSNDICLYDTASPLLHWFCDH